MDCIELDMPVPHVAVVRLARPPVNALDRRAREELVEVMDRLQERDDVRCAVLTGQGRIFCAGADIKEKARLSDDGAGRHAADRLTRDVFFAFLESAVPVVGAVNGPALGAGMVLACCCDVLLAADDATFAMPEIDVGQGGGASLLQRVVPRLVMRKMMLTGERVPASEFHRLGIVDRCVPRDALLDAAVELAAVIAAKSPTAVRTIRESLPTVEGLSPAEGFRLEQRYTSALSASGDAAEARRAFFEKRPPRF